MLRRVRDRYIKAGIRRDFFIDKNKRGKVQDFYERRRKLGEGSFGLVYLVVDKRSNEERVLKVINKAKSQMPAEEDESDPIMLARCTPSKASSRSSSGESGFSIVWLPS